MQRGRDWETRQQIYQVARRMHGVVCTRLVPPEMVSQRTWRKRPAEPNRQNGMCLISHPQPPPLADSLIANTTLGKTKNWCSHARKVTPLCPPGDGDNLSPLCTGGCRSAYSFEHMLSDESIPEEMDLFCAVPLGAAQMAHSAQNRLPADYDRYDSTLPREHAFKCTLAVYAACTKKCIPSAKLKRDEDHDRVHWSRKAQSSHSKMHLEPSDDLLYGGSSIGNRHTKAKAQWSPVGGDGRRVCWSDNVLVERCMQRIVREDKRRRIAVRKHEGADRKNAWQDFETTNRGKHSKNGNPGKGKYNIVRPRDRCLAMVAKAIHPNLPCGPSCLFHAHQICLSLAPHDLCSPDFMVFPSGEKVPVCQYNPFNEATSGLMGAFVIPQKRPESERAAVAAEPLSDEERNAKITATASLLMEKTGAKTSALGTRRHLTTPVQEAAIPQLEKTATLARAPEVAQERRPLPAAEVIANFHLEEAVTLVRPTADTAPFSEARIVQRQSHPAHMAGIRLRSYPPAAPTPAPPELGGLRHRTVPWPANAIELPDKDEPIPMEIFDVPSLNLHLDEPINDVPATPEWDESWPSWVPLPGPLPSYKEYQKNKAKLPVHPSLAPRPQPMGPKKRERHSLLSGLFVNLKFKCRCPPENREEPGPRICACELPRTDRLRHTTPKTKYGCVVEDGVFKPRPVAKWRLEAGRWQRVDWLSVVKHFFWDTPGVIPKTAFAESLTKLGHVRLNLVAEGSAFAKPVNEAHEGWFFTRESWSHWYQRGLFNLTPQFWRKEVTSIETRALKVPTIDARPPELQNSMLQMAKGTREQVKDKELPSGEVFDVEVGTAYIRREGFGSLTEKYEVVTQWVATLQELNASAEYIRKNGHLVLRTKPGLNIPVASRPMYLNGTVEYVARATELGFTAVPARRRGR